MQQYLVQWGIDVDADSPVDAARGALAIQRDPSSIASVFTVVAEDGAVQKVDLQEIDEQGEGEVARG